MPGVNSGFGERNFRAKQDRCLFFWGLACPFQCQGNGFFLIFLSILRLYLAGWFAERGKEVGKIRRKLVVLIQDPVGINKWGPLGAKA